MTAFFLLEVDGVSKATLEDASGSLVWETHVPAVGFFVRRYYDQFLGAS